MVVPADPVSAMVATIMHLVCPVKNSVKLPKDVYGSLLMQANYRLYLMLQTAIDSVSDREIPIDADECQVLCAFFFFVLAFVPSLILTMLLLFPQNIFFF